MSKTMLIVSEQDRHKVEEIFEEDMQTYIDYVMDAMVDRSNYEKIAALSEVLSSDMKAIGLMDIAKMVDNLIVDLHNKSVDNLKTELVLMNNYVSDLQIIYNQSL